MVTKITRSQVASLVKTEIKNQHSQAETQTKETVARDLSAFLDGDPGLLLTRNAQGRLRQAEKDERASFAERFAHPVVREWVKKAGLTFADLAVIYPDADRDHWVDLCLGEWGNVVFMELHK